MTGIPTSIRVGYRDIAVEAYTTPNFDRHGEYETSTGTIRLSMERPPQRLANTLLHEVLHAAWENTNLPAKAAEEDVVTSLANQLAQVWRDNPTLIAYLSETLGARP